MQKMTLATLLRGCEILHHENWEGGKGTRPGRFKTGSCPFCLSLSRIIGIIRITSPCIKAALGPKLSTTYLAFSFLLLLSIFLDFGSWRPLPLSKMSFNRMVPLPLKWIMRWLRHACAITKFMRQCTDWRLNYWFSKSLHGWYFLFCFLLFGEELGKFVQDCA